MPAPPPEWYASAQAAICLAAGWAILAMYFRGTPVRSGEAAPQPLRDPGLLWLGLAMAVWGLVGLLLLLPLDPGTTRALRPLLSSANSAFLLIAASHLDYGVEILQRARERPWWSRAALGGAFAVALLTLVLYALVGPDPGWRQLPDFLLSSVTLLLYGFGMFRSFLKRGFAPLAVLAVLAIGLQFVAQLPEVTGRLAPLGLHDDRRWTLNLVSKAVALVAFLSLAMTWVHELARRPVHASVRLYFTGEHRVAAQNRRRWLVRVGGEMVELRERPHRDLLKLAVHRLRDGGNGTAAGSPCPIWWAGCDDSRIRRLREDLRPAGLDAAIESNFQKAYRLAIQPEHIGFDSEALAGDRELADILRPLPAAQGSLAHGGTA